MKTSKTEKILLVLIFLLTFYGIFSSYKVSVQSYYTKPSDLLGFQVPTYNTSELINQTAQAELTRHGIECKIDGEFGKQTAIGICILLEKIENGYKVNNIYSYPRKDNIKWKKYH